MATAVSPAPPLCVDMDGTLLRTDLLWESLLVLAKTNPARLASLPFWVFRGKAHFKRRVADSVVLNPAVLPFRADVVEFLRAQRADGRLIVLATAADERVARNVAAHLGLFDAVLASDGLTNLSGHIKRKELERYCGERGFDYIGNSAADLPVWSGANEAHLVDPAPRLLRQASGVAKVSSVFQREHSRYRPVLRSLRLHQWVKNLLLFVPLVLSHQVTDLSLVVRAAIAFLVFGLCASGVYIANDLLDLTADRMHPNKRHRPFAAGQLSIPAGLALSALLLITGLTLAVTTLPLAFNWSIAAYVVTTSLYSLAIKRVELLDVFVLAGLYTLRVVAGGLAVNVDISPWLYAFSMFLFTSLAFLKRYTELQLLNERKQLVASGRGYVVADLSFLRSVGPTCGLLAVLVLALYVNSQEVLELYRAPELLWFAIAAIAYWVIHLWFVAQRGGMHDDPIVFAAKDRVSYVIGACVALAMTLASIPLR